MGVCMCVLVHLLICAPCIWMVSMAVEKKHHKIITTATTKAEKKPERKSKIERKTDHDLIHFDKKTESEVEEEEE